MADLSLMTNTLKSWILTPLFWILIIFGFVIVVFGFLYLRKRKRLIYPAAEIVNLGSGKTNLNFLGKKGAGWFGEKTYFWSIGLLDYGTKVMKLSDGSVIHNFSEEDFQEVNGIRAVVFYRNPENRLLFPLSELSVEGKELTAKIAPDDYVGTSAKILNEAEEEMKKSWEKAMPYILTAAAIIFALIALIVIAQLMKNTNETAASMFKEGGQACMDFAKTACTELIKSYSLPASGNAP